MALWITHMETLVYPDAKSSIGLPWHPIQVIHVENATRLDQVGPARKARSQAPYDWYPLVN